jgi:hypothetical protein
VNISFSVPLRFLLDPDLVRAGSEYPGENLKGQIGRNEEIELRLLSGGVPDPEEPSVIGPPGSESVSQMHVFGSSHYQAKPSKKNF